MAVSGFSRKSTNINVIIKTPKILILIADVTVGCFFTSMVKKFCNKAGCTRLAEAGHKYCDKHAYLDVPRERPQLPSTYTKEEKALYTSKEWLRLKEKFLTNGVCARCGAPAEELHHNFPPDYNYRNKVDFFDENNLVPLCHKCHSDETNKSIGIRNRRINKLWY